MSLINAAGGVLGHKLTCKVADTRGDPADAVPAAEQLTATTSNLFGIVGVTSDEALAVAPLINKAQIPFFSTTGQSQFDHNHYAYFFRLTAPDDFGGYALALWGHFKNYKRAALVFGNDVGSQGTVPTLRHGLATLGTPAIVSDQTLALDQSSYRSEVESMLAKHPDVIFTELDPQSAVTFLTDLKQLGGLNIPIVGDSVMVDPTYDGPIANAIGVSAFRRLFTFESPYAETTGPGFGAYEKAVLAVKGVSGVSAYVNNSAVQELYDGINLMALAAVKTHSTDPKTFTPAITQLTKPTPGATKVWGFAAGENLLKAGKPIQYVGLSGGAGGIVFDSSHNSPGETALWDFPGSPTGNPEIVPNSPLFTPAQLLKLEQ